MPRSRTPLSGFRWKMEQASCSDRMIPLVFLSLKLPSILPCIDVEIIASHDRLALAAFHKTGSTVSLNYILICSDLPYKIDRIRWRVPA